MNRKEKKVNLLLSMVTACSLWQMPVSVLANESSESPAAAPEADIFPVPQSIRTDSEDGMRLQGPVDIVVHGTRSHAAVEKTEALLDAQSLAHQEVTPETADPDHARIVLCVECEEECQTCSMLMEGLSDEAGALTHPQGYVLKTSDAANPKGEVIIAASDTDGVYYGVMSLRQLLQQQADGLIAEVSVSDYPDVLYRGYVEGFYGTPWTFEDRTSLFEDTSLYKMNTYVYAPKDDPYHRASWRTLYPEDKAEEIRQLVATADANNMIFCWTIHPGADYDYTTDADGDGVVDDYQALLDKVDQVYSLGVRQFGIFYDDLNTGSVSGTAHAETLNSVYDHLMNTYGDVKPMVTVLTRYTNSWGASTGSYLKPFMDLIHKDTLVLWTGNSTMSAVTKEYFEWPKTQTGVSEDFGVWWNYPVTDYYHGHLLMGPLECVDNDVDNIASFYMNPMSEADASKVTIFSGGDYAWNTEAFDAKASWRRSIQELVPEAWEEFCRFADNLAWNDQGNGFVFKESQYLEDDIAALRAALAGNGDLDAAAEVLKADFEQITEDCTALRNLHNQNLQEEINAYVDQYEKVGQTGIKAIDGLIAAGEGNVEKTMSEVASLRTELAALKNASVKTGDHVLIPLIGEINDAITARLAKGLVPEDGCSIAVDGRETELELVNGCYVWDGSSTSFAKGESAVIRLSRPNNFSIDVQNGTGTWKVEVSLNGLDWTEADPEEDALYTGCYIRLTAQENSAVPGVVSVKKAVEAKKNSVSTNMVVYQNYVPSQAFDGDLETCFWSGANAESNAALTLSLNGVYSISSVEVVAGINRLDTIDCMKTAVIETSMDGIHWTAAGQPFGEANFERRDGDSVHAFHTVTFEPVNARYIRMRGTEASSVWVKIYEILPEMEVVENNGAAVSASFTSDADHPLGNAADGNPATWALGDAGEGSWIQADLGNFIPLYDASITFADDGAENAAAFAQTRLQISRDGKTWQDASALVSASDLDRQGSGWKASWSLRGEPARFIRFTGAQAGSALRVGEISWNEKVDALAPGSISASTDMKTYQQNVIGNAVDGDTSTRFYSSAETKAGNYIQLTLGDNVQLYDASIIYGGDPHRTAVDGFAATKLQVSTDGKTWTDAADAVESKDYKVVDGRYICSFTLDGIEASYVRFTATADSSSWCQVYEAEINRTLDVNRVRLTSGTASVFNSDRLMDGDLKTSPNFYQITEGQTLVVPMTSVTDVKLLGILQSSASKSATKVEVQKLDGSWVEVGVLDQEWNSFEIEDTIRAMRLTFDGSVQPEIFEMIVQPQDQTPAEQADKTLLRWAADYADAQVAAGALENLNETALAYFEQTLAQARDVLADDAASAAQVEDAWTKLSKAIHMLSFKADKSALALLVSQAQQITPAGSEEAVAAFEEALAHAQEVLSSTTALQESIDEAASALQQAMNALHPEEIDTSLLELLCQSVSGISTDLYLNNHGEVDVLLAALEAGQNVLAAPVSQQQVDEAVDSLHTAWLALRLIPDESLLAEMDTFLAEAASADLSLYTADEQALITSAIQRVQDARNNPDLDQTQAVEVLDSIKEAKALLQKQPASASKADPAGTKNSTAQAASVKTAAAAGSSMGWTQSAAAAGLALLALWKKRRK